MSEVDDRLFGDPVWELFASPVEERAEGFDRYQGWLIVAAVSVALWFVSPALAFSIAAISIGVPDFRRGCELARLIPEKAGGAVCARFSYAWGCWKIAIGSFCLFTFASFLTKFSSPKGNPAPPDLVSCLMLMMGGIFLSSIFTAMGLLAAYRSGMRIWIGEGVNRARTLLMIMLCVFFAIFLLMPFLLSPMPRHLPINKFHDDHPQVFLALGLACVFSGPAALLVVLDRICRRIVATSPGKFGPKVPVVGKWNPVGRQFETSPSKP